MCDDLPDKIFPLGSSCLWEQLSDNSGSDSFNLDLVRIAALDVVSPVIDASLTVSIGMYRADRAGAGRIKVRAR